MQKTIKGIEMKNAVIYARYSSDKQTELSIEAQLTACYNYAKAKDLNVIHEYIDRAYTGRNDNRPEFRKMIKDSDKHNFDYVLVYKLDRFARNRYDSAINKKALRNNGVRVLSAMEHLTDTPESILMESFIEGYAEYYSAELSQKIKNNQAELIKHKGRSLGGNRIYGYKVVDNFYQIDEEQAKNVKIIFTEYARSGDIPTIIEKMKVLGIKTASNNNYTRKTVERFLSNKRYIGIYEFAGQVLEDYFPVIIDKATFGIVQERLKNRQKGKRNTMDFILSGKLFCGHCHRLMQGDSGTGRKKMYCYYTCPNKKEKKGCQKESVSKDWLENFLVDATIKYVFDNQRFKSILEEIKKVYKKYEQKSTELDDLKRQKSKLIKQQQNIINVIKEGQHNKAMYAELDNLEAELEVIDAHITKAEYLSKNELTFDKIEFMLCKLKDMENKEQQKKIVLNSFINYVVLWDDKIEIHYNLSKDDTQIIKLKEEKNSSDNGNNSGGNSTTGTNGEPIKFSPVKDGINLVLGFSLYSLYCFNVVIG